jgi:TolB-like protein/DNA-binding winged helix-turn-helix (wHTH) protein/Tfp pilus assembly protein PilF
MSSTGASAKNIATFGPFEVNLETGEIRKHGLRIRLPEQSFRILAMLLERPGELVRREELEKTLWPDNLLVDSEHGLNSAIKKLRQVLGDSAERPRWVETVARRGHRFIGPVKVQCGASARGEQDMEASATPPNPRAVVAAATPSGGRPRKSRHSALIGACISVLALAASVKLYVNWHRDSPLSAMAVLPFLNVTADPDIEFFSDGLTESLINSLSQLPGLRVLARSTVVRYKDGKADPATAGRELQVGAVVAGDVLRRNDRLVVRVHLIRASDGSQIWGERYERPASDGLAIHDEIASHIANNLGSRLTPDEKRGVVSHGTSNNKAFELYMRGVHHFNKRNEQAIRTALRYFVQATEADPMYAVAFASVGTCYALLPMYAAVPPEWAYPRAEAAALKSVELDRRIAEPHAVLGLVRNFQWDWRGAEEELRTAISLNPNYLNARVWYAETIALTRSAEAAFPQFQKAQQLEPASLFANTQLGFGLFLLRRFDDAIEQLKKTLELDPTFILTHLRLMYAYLEKQMFKEATAEAERFCALSGDKRDVEYLAVVHARSGSVEKARQLLGELHEIGAHTYVSPVSFANVYLSLGNKSDALRMLEDGVETKATDIIGLREPIWDALRSEPRFRALLKKMNLPL